VVLHIPSFFEELDTLEAQGILFLFFFRVAVTLSPGLDCNGRLFVSDRAQLVFDFHQIVDGLKEIELGGSRCVLLL
jgi:adenylosuccinate synthase